MPKVAFWAESKARVAGVGCLAFTLVFPRTVLADRSPGVHRQINPGVGGHPGTIDPDLEQPTSSSLSIMNAAGRIEAVVFDLLYTLVHPQTYPGGTGREGWLAHLLGVEEADLQGRWESFEPSLEAGRVAGSGSGLCPELDRVTARPHSQPPSSPCSRS